MPTNPEGERAGMRVLVRVSTVAVVTMLALGVLGYGSAKGSADADGVLDWYIVSVVAVIGTVTLAGVFWKMKPGFREYSLRAVGIVLVATLVTLLASSEEGYRDSAMGILGAIAGYLFGKEAQEPTGGNIVAPAAADTPGDSPAGEVKPAATKPTEE